MERRCHASGSEEGSGLRSIIVIVSDAIYASGSDGGTLIWTLVGMGGDAMHPRGKVIGDVTGLY